MVTADNVYVSKEGLKFRITQKDSHWCTIYHDERGIMSRATLFNIKKGEARLLKNNGGYIRCKSPRDYSQLIKTPAYSCWVNMLNRVGKGKYEHVEIHEEWLDFLIFKRFYDTWYRDGFVLDKDLLSGDKKIYSESTCCFIPNALNTAIREFSREESPLKSDRKSYNFIINFRYSPIRVKCKTKKEYISLYSLYRSVKVRTLLSLYERQIRPEAVEKIIKLYNYIDYGKNTDSSTL